MASILQIEQFRDGLDIRAVWGQVDNMAYIALSIRFKTAQLAESVVLESLSAVSNECHNECFVHVFVEF